MIVISENEKRYIKNIAIMIREGKTIPSYPLKRIVGRSLGDLTEAQRIYRSVLNK